MNVRLLLAAALLAIPCHGAVPTPKADSGALRFVAPRDLSTVLGPATVTLAVDAPSGITVVRIEITLDGKPLATLDGPPWAAPWNAGENGGNHRLTARAILSDGSELHAVARTSRLRVDQEVEVALVNVYTVAKDRKGDYVRDLRQEEIRVFENGRAQTIDRFSPERKPLKVALVLDTSLSMKGEKIDEAKRSALEFLAVLQPGDQGMVIAFSDRVRVLQDVTDDIGAIAAAIRSVEAQGGTALYDAIWTASERLEPLDGRRAIVLLSDGRDEAASGLEPGSLHTLDESTDRALRAEAMIFAIGLGERLARDAKRLDDNPRAAADEMDFFGRKPLAAILKGFADTTGGRAIFSSSAGRLRRAYEDVADDLRHQYVIAYAPDDRRHDGSWREIRVQTTRDGVAITNRKGYFAPKDSATR